MLSWLVTAIWLVTLGPSFSATACACAGESLGLQVCSCDPGQHGPLKETFSVDQSVRNLSRRNGTQPGLNGFSGPLRFSELLLPELRRSENSFVTAEAGPGLANCWQFLSRTAPEPRAPSSVS